MIARPLPTTQHREQETRYRKRNIPRNYPLTIERNGQSEEVLLPLGKFPATMQLLEYEPPVYLAPRPYKSGINVNGNVIVQVGGPPIQEVANKLGVKRIKFAATFEGNTYERLLLKVAYGFAVANIGLTGIAQGWVIPSILGRTDDVGKWLGCDGKQLLNPAFFHSVGIAIVGNDILCRVRLFARYNTPEYLVVVGKAEDGVSIS